MKKASYIFEIIRQVLHSKEFSNKYKIGAKSFLRERVMTYRVIFLFILNLLNESIPKELISFCGYCEIEEVSRSAITQARAKLSFTGFIALKDVLITEFYKDNIFKTVCGLVVLAIDGSTLELPINSPSIVDKYGFASNQTGLQIPLARTSMLYDVMNGLTWDGIISPYKTSEREMVIQHIENIKLLRIDLEQILIVFDRGYPSVALITYLLKNKIKFLIRCGRQFLKDVGDVMRSGRRDTTVKICLKKSSRAAKAELRKLFPDLDMNEFITIRVVIVTLSTGEKEILLTSLLNKEEFSYKIFRKLYFMRWGVEESYKFHKIALEMENFSGKTCLVVEQDFHATILAANARALLAQEAQEERVGKEHLEYAYEINKKVSLARMKNSFIRVLLDPTICLEAFCDEMKNKMNKEIVPIRPGRSFKRIRKYPHRRFHMNLR